MVLVILNACQNVKSALSGKKQSSSDEFLVEKKNPLTLPPEFNKLPVPKTLTKKDNNTNEVDIRTILTKETLTIKKSSVNKTSNESLEKNILEKIKEIEIIQFDHKDVVRHPLVSKIIKAYKKKDDD